jgi:hypothetical protein
MGKDGLLEGQVLALRGLQVRLRMAREMGDDGSKDEAPRTRVFYWVFREMVGLGGGAEPDPL